MTASDHGIIRGTKYENAPAQFAPAGGVSPKELASMLNHSTPNSTIETKTCSRCGEAKPRSSFYDRPGRPGVPRAHCKRCHLQGAAPESRWQVMTKGMRKRLGYAPSVPSLRNALGEPETCYLCGDKLQWDSAVVDHVIPVSRGGDHSLSNLKWTHRECNSAKGAMTIREFAELARKVIEVHGGTS